MQYNNKFTMADLFQNRKLANILPQFYKRDGLKNIYSFKWIEEKIKRYIKGIYRAREREDALIVRGRKRERIKELNKLKSLLESFFNHLPSVTKNIRKNTRLVLPMQSVEEIKQLRTMQEKVKLLELVVENVKYNAEFATKQKSTPLYIKKQKRWNKKVGIV